MHADDAPLLLGLLILGFLPVRTVRSVKMYAVNFPWFGEVDAVFLLLAIVLVGFITLSLARSLVFYIKGLSKLFNIT